MGKLLKSKPFSLVPEPAEDILRGPQDNNEWIFLADEVASTDTLYSAINSHGLEVEDQPEKPLADHTDVQPPTPDAAALPSTSFVSPGEKVSTQKDTPHRRKFVGQYELAEYLVSHYSSGLFQDVPYIKVDGVHVPLTKFLVGKLIDKSYQDKLVKNVVNSNQFSEIREWVHVLLDNEGRNLSLPKYTILFENGAFDILSGKKVRPKETDFFPVRINACYYPDKVPDTPVFDAFIEDCAAGDNQVKRLIVSFLGYMISPGSGKHLILLGPASDSGKSVIINFIRRLLGKNNTCAISIHNFSKSFEVAQLLGKSANFCADISGAILNESTVATLKRLSGRDLETINAKYRDPFPYENYAKMVFACNNNGIRLRTPDDGFANRLTVIPFVESIDKSKQDSALEDKLWLERDGIVHHAVNALREYYFPTESFPYCRTGEIFKAKWLQCYDSSVRCFLEDMCELTPDEKVWTSDLYEQYVQYCCENMMETLTLNQFSRCIHSVPSIQAKKYQQNGIQLQGLFGIGLKKRA